MVKSKAFLFFKTKENEMELNHLKCCVSTGVCGSLTFGQGKLDAHGYWEKPCKKCADEFKKKYPENKCWPKGE